MIIKNFIDGKIVSESKKTLDVFNPSTGEKIADVVNSNLNDFNNVINSSKKGFHLWSKFTPL